MIESMDVKGLVTRGDPNVYPVREDSLLLATSVQVRSGERMLEVGCGHGLASLAAAREGAQVVASDVNPHALRTVKEAARNLALPVEVVLADLLAPFRTFDVILFNPPYLPTAVGEADPVVWQDRALNGGTDGLEAARSFLDQLPGHLEKEGRAYLLVARVPRGPRGPLQELTASRGWFSVRVVGERRLEAEFLQVVELRPVLP